MTVNISILDKDSINDPIFDLKVGETERIKSHGHFLDKDGKVQETNGIRMTVPCLDINPKTLFQMAGFMDDMDGTFTHPSVTIIIKEANKEHNVPAKIGIFAI